MGFGDSLLLSMNATGCSSISGSSTVVNAAPAISKHGNERSSVPRLAGCPKIYGFSPSLESRTVSNGSRKRAFAIRAAKSGSVDAPSSTNSSRGKAQVESHLALLERMTENSTASQGDDVVTIRDQLSSQVEPEASEVVVPLGKGEKESTPVAELTISQKRNIRRQNYLNKSSERNDVPFFAAVAGFVLVPPILILAFAVATGYVEFFP